MSLTRFSQLILPLFIALLALSACNDDSQQEKGLSIDQLSETEGVEDSLAEGVPSKVITRPSDVLLTSHADHRLVTVHRLMQHPSYRGGKTYLGSSYYYRSYNDEEGYPRLNAWHGHYMPGLEAIRGANLLNISHYNMKTKAKNDLFGHSVWVNTLYYPAFEKDTLNGAPVVRDYYMVSAYDEDTNKDSILNYHDLRKFYLFDLEGKRLAQLVPPNYSVISSEYDSANDAMFVYASLDENKNGKRETEEPVHIFWFSLKSPAPGERLY